jgi:hypothetical protein
MKITKQQLLARIDELERDHRTFVAALLEYASEQVREGNRTGADAILLAIRDAQSEIE